MSFFLSLFFPQPLTPGSNSTITPGLRTTGVVFSSLGLVLPFLILVVIVCMCSIFLCCETCVKSCEYCMESCQYRMEDYFRDARNSLHDARRRRKKTKGWKPCLTYLHGYAFSRHGTPLCSLWGRKILQMLGVWGGGEVS